jgi:hypothetical protein
MLQFLQSHQNREETAAGPDSSSMCDVEELTTVGAGPNVNDLLREELTQVYNNYSFAHSPQNSLSIMAHKEKVSKM